jgi:hypothetical protein
VAFDEKDNKLGNYFQECKNDIFSFLNDSNDFDKTLFEISSDKCNEAFIDISLAAQKELPFLFIAYSHGNENGLIASGNLFVRAGNDNAVFQNTLFYATACFSGLNLGPDLISQGCKSFIGYDRKIDGLLDVHQKLSIQCDNYALKAFCSQEITIYEAFKQMVIYISQEIEKLRNFGDILRAGILMNTREALVFIGDESLVIDHLYLPNSK